MKRLLCFLILLINAIALAQLPPYVRNPITTNAPGQMTNEVLKVSRSGPFEVPTRLIFIGDSISSGMGLTNAASFPRVLTNKHTLNNLALWTNAAVPGRTLASLTNAYATEIYPLRSSGGTNAIVNILVGANDWGSISSLAIAEEYANRLDAFLNRMKSDGFSVSACTPTVVGAYQVSAEYGFW